MITLIDNGTPRARIVLPASPLPVEQHAAEELNSFLSRMSGAVLPVTNEPSPGEANIFIGSAAPGEVKLTEELLGFDGFVVRTLGDDLVLAGVKPYSCLYAVYHLLDAYLGCGFFQDGDQVPERKTVEVGGLDVVQKPHFEWRTACVMHTLSYSNMRWNDWTEWKHYIDWAIRKRFNICQLNWMIECTGIAALAAQKMGVHIELTDWQKQNIKLMRRLLDYARMCGMRHIAKVEWHTPFHSGEPGYMPHPDHQQLIEFVDGYEKLTGKRIPQIDYEWCGIFLKWLDARDPDTIRFVKASVEAFRETLGDDHLYHLVPPNEGKFMGTSQEDQDTYVRAAITDVARATREADPDAVVFTWPPFRYATTAGAAARAMREAKLSIMSDHWLQVAATQPDFQANDYYWGLEWSTGMVMGCGKTNNPCADLQTAIDRSKQFVADPRTYNCKGFFYGSEYNFRQHVWQDLICELSWNPATVDRDEFLRLWSIRRYGPDAAGAMHPATMLIANSLLSYPNRDTENIPLYRTWGNNYIPGLPASSVRRTLSYLPAMREALEIMASAHEQLEDSPLYRFDLVDYGRTYLGSLFNARLARARKSLVTKDRSALEAAAAGVEEVMHFMARYTSSHPIFRLKTHDDRAARFPQVLPGYENALHNWVTFTSLHSLIEWTTLLDYSADDYAEMVEHYYWPRVRLYLDNMRKFIETGEDITRSLEGFAFRISDWAPPVGDLPWSPYGATFEPQLKEGDEALVKKMIFGESPSGKFDFYEGPMLPLVTELLDRFPIPGDLQEILAEPDPTDEAFERILQARIDVAPGERVQGFRSDPVEMAKVPEELGYVAHVRKLGKTYNIMRGEVATYRVEITDRIELTRLPDTTSQTDGHAIAMFEFEAEDSHWIMSYDQGSENTFASLSIVTKG